MPSKPITSENLPQQIHHRSTFWNTPILKTNKLPAQTPQPMKSDAVKKGYSAGIACLGEFSPLKMSDPSSREMNTVESKKRKLLLTETSMDLDLEIGDEQNIDAALPKGPNHHIKAVLPQGPNHHIEAFLPQGPNHHIKAVLHQGPNHNRSTPSSVLLQGLNRATPSSVWPSDLITIL